MGFTKPELVAEVAKQVGLTKADAGRALDCIIKSIVEGVQEGGRVEVAGLGTFRKFRCAAVSRPSIQDRTKIIDTPARNTVKFKPCPALKAAVQ